MLHDEWKGETLTNHTPKAGCSRRQGLKGVVKGLPHSLPETAPAKKNTTE